MSKKRIISPQDEMFIEIWRLLFAHRFGFKVDFSKFKIPPARSELVLPIVMPKELMRGKVGLINRIFGVCEESFPCWSYYDDLDASIVHDDRSPKNGSYAIRAGNHQEATDGDDELKDLSASDICARALPIMALPERLMQELYVFHTTGGHLDKRDGTLCAGSRNSDGSVPYVCWRGGELRVRCYSPDDHFGCLRTRAAVS